MRYKKPKFRYRCSIRITVRRLKRMSCWIRQLLKTMHLQILRNSSIERLIEKLWANFSCWIKVALTKITRKLWYKWMTWNTNPFKWPRTTNARKNLVCGWFKIYNILTVILSGLLSLVLVVNFLRRLEKMQLWKYGSCVKTTRWRCLWRSHSGKWRSTRMIFLTSLGMWTPKCS